MVSSHMDRISFLSHEDKYLLDFLCQGNAAVRNENNYLVTGQFSFEAQIHIVHLRAELPIDNTLPEGPSEMTLPIELQTPEEDLSSSSLKL